jgi:ribosomal protein S18 acetylase RimI-like enzyme
MSKENEEDYLQIKLRSDAFEDGIPTFYKQNPTKYYEDISPIHKLLFRFEKKEKPLSISISYKKISDDKYIEDIINLFKEWFPFSYDRDYMRKYFVKKSCIAIGAFIKINSKEYIIGCALGEIISEDKFKKILPDVLIQSNWFFSEPDPVDCGVLQNLGVIDEYRRLGVGTRLMEMFIEEVKIKEGVAIYLSTVGYNNSAIKFFENNQWYFYNSMDQYYRINEDNYEAKIYYYIIDIKKCKKIKKKEIKNNNQQNGLGGKSEIGVEEISEHKEKGCLAGILGFFSSNKD